MKRLLLFGILLLLLTAAPGTVCRAAPEPAEADIWVQIKNGGTAVITAEADAPLPDPTRLVLTNGQAGAFHFVFTEVGVFTYTVRTEPDNRDISFDRNVYTVRAHVIEENDKLVVTVVIYDAETGNKYAVSSYGNNMDSNLVAEGLFGIAFDNTPEKEVPTPSPGRPSKGGGTPSRINGSTPEEDGTPTEGGGTPSEEEGRTTGEDGTPLEGGGTPSEEEGQTTGEDGTPLEGGGTPSEEEGQTTGEDGTPLEGGGTPSGTDSLPTEGGGTPSGTGGTPSEGGGTPAPGRGTSSDRGGTAGGSPAGGSTDRDGAHTEQPKTVDASDLDRYLLTALLSSAGLFLLSILYYITVDRDRKREH